MWWRKVVYAAVSRLVCSRTLTLQQTSSLVARALKAVPKALANSPHLLACWTAASGGLVGIERAATEGINEEWPLLADNLQPTVHELMAQVQDEVRRAVPATCSPALFSGGVAPISVALYAEQSKVQDLVLAVLRELLGLAD